MNTHPIAWHPDGRPRHVAVVGGTGFLGRYVVKQLADLGFNLRVISRHAPRADYLKPLGAPGQITLLRGNITNARHMGALLQGCDAVVNLVGLLYESGKQQFAAVHAQGTEQLAKAAAQHGVRQFVHVSALGVDKSINSKYARTKATGEKALRASFPNATILRPSIIFGAEDNFFNQFACLGSLLPALPLIGGGKTKFQPVYVADVARAVCAALLQPQAMGKTYELGGPSIVSFADVLRYIAQHTGHQPCLVPLPFEMAGLVASFTGWMPKPLITRDQVRLLRTDNCVAEDALTLADLGIAATHMDAIIPAQLLRFRKHGFAAARPDAA